MRKFNIVLQVCFLSCVCNAESLKLAQPGLLGGALLGSRLLLNTISEGVRNIKRIRDETQSRPDLFGVLQRSKSYQDTQTERQKRIQELRKEIIDERSVVRLHRNDNDGSLEVELKELLSTRAKSEIEAGEKDSFFAELRDPQPGVLKEFVNGVDIEKPRIWLAPGAAPPSTPGSQMQAQDQPTEVTGLLIHRNGMIPQSTFYSISPVSLERCLYDLSSSTGGGPLTLSGECSKESWEAMALQWHLFVKSDGTGDPNRHYLSDPAIFRLLGIRPGQENRMTILDIGCGNGYLARSLAHSGARVRGVDPAGALLNIAVQSSYTPVSSRIEYGRDSASRLDTVATDYADAAVMNYVLQDCANLEDCVAQLYRVLKPNGKAVIVIPHPCFPTAYRNETVNGSVTFDWKNPYGVRHVQMVSLNGLEADPIIVYHRPIQDYIKVFKSTGFYFEDLEEPHLTEAQRHTLHVDVAKKLDTSTPRSIVLLFRKDVCKSGADLAREIQYSGERLVQAALFKVGQFLSLLPNLQTVVSKRATITFKIEHPCFQVTNPYFRTYTLSYLFQQLRAAQIEVRDMDEFIFDSDLLPSAIVLALQRAPTPTTTPVSFSQNTEPLCFKAYQSGVDPDSVPSSTTWSMDSQTCEYAESRSSPNEELTMILNKPRDPTSF